ncbi:hypothetical protein Rhopal_000336-T1 [Rhodotorula paludigena]|uniref:Tse2 ADP-ribosyltransferase toxin domain-containing protein n=1 Tax=Rhodotorula paludigena TaxID=86838 RepID=A0AAV5GDH5_9BASI|nr:hypothetical protein Rhopal_000336-T1 [Rhodotorula paludigena]
MLGKHTVFPFEIFRVNAGHKVNLRDHDEQAAKGRSSYDLYKNADGLVEPIEGSMFEKPNGCSMRPDGPMAQEIIRNFPGRNTVVWRVPEGTPIPPSLVLYHEHSDHYSLQTTEPVKLPELNRRITAFLDRNGEKMTKEEWADRYPF